MHAIRARLPLALATLLGTLAVFLLVPLGIERTVAPFSYTSIDEVPGRAVAIVLGASVYQGVPSPVLAARAHAAAELFLSGKVQQIFISGDDSPYHDEVTPTKKYLMQSGVPAENIVLDREGFDTFLSMYHARRLYSITSAIVVTQDFHMPRALFLARGVGIDAVGLEADEGQSPLYSYAREIPAMWKALLDLLLRDKR